MGALETVVKELKDLPEDKLEAVAEYARSLRKRDSGRFDDLAGCLTSEEADRLEKAIEESCERIESSDQVW